MILAAGAAPAFFTEIALLLIATAATSYVCHRLGITPIVSFLITGALIGPHALGLVEDQAVIDAAAEVGVILLLFTIGIEFSLDKLARIQRLIFLGGGLQVGLILAFVTGVLLLFGLDWRMGVFTGCLVALSSTAIVMKLLVNRGETDTTGGQTALGILIFQDLAVVAMVLLVPILGGDGGSGLDILWALAKAAGLIVLVLVVARRVMPRVLEAVARTCSQEIFLLTVVAICFGTAFLTSMAGVSLSLGAFMAGLVVSESRFSQMAFGEIMPLQILFSATFFVSVGLLLDFSFLVSNLPLVVGVVAVVLLVKALATGASVLALGAGTGTAAFTGLLLAQVGEFSFVLERTGRETGLYPAGLEDGGPQTFIAATVLSMIVTPYLAQAGAALARTVHRRTDEATMKAMRTSEAHQDDHAFDDLTDHVIIAGFGTAGQQLAEALADQQIPHLILTLSPTGATHAEGRRLRVLRGDYTRQHTLQLAGLDRARLLVVADDADDVTHRVVSVVRALQPTLPILARTHAAHEVQALQTAGAAHVVSEEAESLAQLMHNVLAEYEIDDDAIAQRVAALRAGTFTSLGAPPSEQAIALSTSQRANTTCTHTQQAQPVVPSAEGCTECLAMGDTWVHLRICMTCGHVGCCDSSKNKHATQHHHTTGHPIVRSYEPGETWAWCYVDEMML